MPSGCGDNGTFCIDVEPAAAIVRRRSGRRWPSRFADGRRSKPLRNCGC